MNVTVEPLVFLDGPRRIRLLGRVAGRATLIVDAFVSEISSLHGVELESLMWSEWVRLIGETFA
jgi:hypothetical protein